MNEEIFGTPDHQPAVSYTHLDVYKRQVYDQPVPYLAFLFDPIEQVSGDTTPRLIEIRFLYDKNAKLEDIWDSIKSVYGESSQFTVRDEFSDSYSTWAKSRQTLLEAFTPSAKEAMREVCKDIIYSSEDEFEESLNVPLVEVSSFGEEYKSDSLYMIPVSYTHLDVYKRQLYPSPVIVKLIPATCPSSEVLISFILPVFTSRFR